MFRTGAGAGSLVAPEAVVAQQLVALQQQEKKKKKKKKKRRRMRRHPAVGPGRRSVPSRLWDLALE